MIPHDVFCIVHIGSISNVSMDASSSNLEIVKGFWIRGRSQYNVVVVVVVVVVVR